MRGWGQSVRFGPVSGFGVSQWVWGRSVDLELINVFREFWVRGWGQSVGFGPVSWFGIRQWVWGRSVDLELINGFRVIHRV